MKILFYFSCFVVFIANFIVLFWNPDWICHVHGDVNYVWYDGIWHGFWAIPHFTRDIFTYTKCMSHHAGTMYYICFWVTLILSYIVYWILKPKSTNNDSENEKRLERLASTKKERMQNALASRVAAWFSEIESKSDKHPSSEKLQSLPLLGQPNIFNDAEKESNIPELITTQIMDFVFSEDEDSLSESDIKELRDLLSSTLREHGIDCKDDAIDELIDASFSYIDESIKASQELYC